MKFIRLPALVIFAAAILVLASQTAQAKDEWIQVKSKNFLLIGNASEKEIRKVGTRLEQFRETFRLLFSKANLTSPIPTNVVVFKSASSYKNFKPKRGDGKIDTGIAGYFQPGEDVNYITLSTEGEDADTFSTIFHEYVHFIVGTNFGKSQVPAWFNEGLAEYYSTFTIEDDQTIKLGLPETNHLYLLNQSKLMPLASLFTISNYQLHATGGHSRSIFYAQSWALLHYLMQSGKNDALSKFLGFLLKKVPPEKAFQDAFQISPVQMDKELSSYVGKRTFRYNIFTLKEKMVFDAQMVATPLSEAESNAYLGDLLYHTHRFDDAEPYLLTALRTEPESGIANIALGLVRMKQRKLPEARELLEKALAGDAKNHAAYYWYAYILSREGTDEFGFVREFSSDSAAKMRTALRKAITLNPSFTESYELLAYVNLVTGEQLDDAIALLKTALKYQPGNQRYALRIAEILVRQDKFADAAATAQQIASTTDDPETKNRAERLLSSANRSKEFADQQAADRKRYENQPSGGEIIYVDDPDANVRSINEALRKTEPGEKRVIGSIQKIDCRARPLVYTVKTPTETFTLTTHDFDSLALNAFTPEANKIQVGCDEDLSSVTAVITYRPNSTVKGTARGELVAIEFVRSDFKFLDPLAPPTRRNPSRGDMPITTTAGTLSGPPPARSADEAEQRRAMMMRAIHDALKKPDNGQKREIGYLEKIECSGKTIVFIIRTTAKTYRLLNTSPETLRIAIFAPELGGLQFGCSIRPVEFPAVFIYTDKPGGKAKTDGEIVSLEFVPKAFVLDP